jgi:GrpB-like predicted nucleotidyltransferase (UPF0157 family)
MVADIGLGRRIAVHDHDPSWAAAFAALHAAVLAAVGDAAIAIEHVGSTSVPGLAARAVIDIDVVVANAADAALAVRRLAAIGYEHQGDLGVAGREAFRSLPGPPERHLYVCLRHAAALQNHLLLRDHLRAHPHRAAAYGRLKRQLAALFPHDVDKYVAGKTDFILAVLRECGLGARQLAAIAAANRPTA